jgi:hypothetical protein
VRRIYEAYASGTSPRTIAAKLNAEGLPAPRGGEWNASTINGHRARRNGILQNDLYKGSLIYNRVRMLKDPYSGKRISRINPKSDWVTIEVPDLRIISDELWTDVQTRRARYGGEPVHKSRRAKRLLSGNDVRRMWGLVHGSASWEVWLCDTEKGTSDRRKSARMSGTCGCQAEPMIPDSCPSSSANFMPRCAG